MIKYFRITDALSTLILSRTDSLIPFMECIAVGAKRTYQIKWFILVSFRIPLFDLISLVSATSFDNFLQSVKTLGA